MANLLVAGHFGCGNLGDDAILVGFAHGLHDSGFNMTVMSGSPEETYRLYGYRSVPRREMKAVERELARADALVFPGGSVFQDVTSTKSVYYYANIVHMAKKARKKVFLLGQGVGPLKSYLGKRWTTQAFNAADAIVVRDPESRATLQSLGVKAPVKMGGDLAFLMPEKVSPENLQFNVGEMKTIGVVPRPYGKDKRPGIELFGELCRMLFQARMMPVLIEMDSKHDGPLIQEISKQQGGKIPDLRKQQTPMQIQGRMSRMDGIISMRLHGGILAATVGIPPLMIGYDPKVVSFAKMLDIEPAVPLENLTPVRLFEKFQGFHKERERNLKIVQRKREEFRALAEVSIQVIKDALGAKTAF